MDRSTTFISNPRVFSLKETPSGLRRSVTEFERNCPARVLLLPALNGKDEKRSLIANKETRVQTNHES